MIPQETISLLLGYTSIGFWLGAQFPQIVVNWRRNSVDGLALPFLANWLLGDSTNLLGCILTNQLPFQTYLATYFVFVDSCLVIQYFYYDASRGHVDASAEGLISSASSIIIAPPPHAPRPRALSRTGASSSISENAVMSSISPTRRRAKSVGPMNMGVGDGPSTGIRSSSRDVTHLRTTTDDVLPRSKDEWDRVRPNADNIDEDNPEANTTQDLQDEEEDSDSHMITSFYSEGGGVHRSSGGKRVSWNRDAASVSRDRDQATPANTARYRRRSRSISFADTTTNITEEVISSSPTNFDGRGRPTTPRSARMTDTEVDEFGYRYEDESAHTYPTQQPFPLSPSLSRERNADSDFSHHHYGSRSRSRRASSTSTSAVTEATSRRSASIVFLGVFVLLGFSTFNHTNYSSTSVSAPSTWQGNVLTPISSEPNNHRRQHYHYYHHPLHHAYQPNTYLTTHIPRNTSRSSLDDDYSDTQKLVGRLAAWSCTTLYLTSRLPQIWKNYTRKSVEGLSMYLFAFAFCGNLFYVLSILSSPNMNLPPEQSREFLRESVPYLLGSGGTLLFDVTIVSQSFIYAKSRRDRKKRMRPRTLSSVMSSASASSRRWRGKIRRKRTAAIMNDEERGLLEEDGLMHEGVGAGMIGGESRDNTARLQAAEIPV